MTIYSLDVLLFLFGASLLLYVQSQLLLPDLHTGFSRDRSGGLVFHLFQNFPLFVLIHTSKDFSVVNGTEVDIFLKFLLFLYDPVNAGNLISGSSVVLKFSLYISVHILLNSACSQF